MEFGTNQKEKARQAMAQGKEHSREKSRACQSCYMVVALEMQGGHQGQEEVLQETWGTR